MPKTKLKPAQKIKTNQQAQIKKHNLNYKLYHKLEVWRINN
jgi:hypothetical protein